MKSEINFEIVKNSIKEDIKSGQYDDMLGIIAETDSYISVYDDIDGFSREYTITNPDIINQQWIKDKIIVTPSVQEMGYNINPEKIANWVFQNIDKDMYLTLENIIFVNDTEKDFDFLSEYSNELSDRLETSVLPDENTIGYMWHCYQTVLINMGSIAESTQDLIDSGIVSSDDKDIEINIGAMMTLTHEIRHLAQSNPYLPEDILKMDGDEEQDAENYAIKVCDGLQPNLIEKVDELNVALEELETE